MDKYKLATFFLQYINNLEVINWIYNEFGNLMVCSNEPERYHNMLLSQSQGGQ